MLHTCLIIDLRFGRYIVDVAATAHQKAVLAVIQPFHAFYASCPVEVRETANADPCPLFDCHSSNTHIVRCLESLKFNSFPFCEASLGFMAGKAFFVSHRHCGQGKDKTSVRRESADGIPKFPRHTEICGRLPSSPPDESAGGTWHSFRPQYLCTKKAAGHKT